jgi:lipopolysaccharide export system permease protein
MKILFITANRLGDAVLSTGVLAHILRQNPSAEITIACGPYAADLFRAIPNLERLIILNKRSLNRHWFELWRQCVGTPWDIIIDMRNSIVSRLLSTKFRACGGGNTGQHKVIENAAVIGVSPPPEPKVWLNDDSESKVVKIIGNAKPLLAFGPAANWPCKQWPVERFAELGQHLTQPDDLLPNASVLIIADERERSQLAPLIQSIPAERRLEVIGQDLLTVAACLKRAQLFVGNDSGLMHLAAAMGTPTLGLFGPGYEEIYGPWGNHCAFVRTPESREELLSRLPNLAAREPNLMGGLTVHKVYQAAKALLNVKP